MAPTKPFYIVWWLVCAAQSRFKSSGTDYFVLQNCWGQRAREEGTSKGNCYFIAENKEKQKGIALASTPPSLGQTALCHFIVRRVGASHMTGVKETIYQHSAFVLQSVCYADGERIVLMKGKQLCKGEF